MATKERKPTSIYEVDVEYEVYDDFGDGTGDWEAAADTVKLFADSVLVAAERAMELVARGYKNTRVQKLRATDVKRIFHGYVQK